MGVFRPLSSYRQSWNPEEGLAASGVFRTLSEERPPATTRDIQTTTIYNSPFEDSVRIKPAVVDSQNVIQSCDLPNKSHVSAANDSRPNSVAGQDNGSENTGYRDGSSERPKRKCNKKSDSSDGSRVESEPSGDSTHYNLHVPGLTASVTVAVSSSRHSKLEASYTLPSGGESEGMHLAARDTGQQHGVGSSGVSPLSRASSPGTNSSSGSCYNFAAATETGDSRGPRTTPMGSTTGLLSDSSSSYSQTKPKVSTGFTRHPYTSRARVKSPTFRNWILDWYLGRSVSRHC
jgi:hypothetical protein